MPPVFGPSSCVADALEVLRRRERHRAVGIAVAHREQRELGTGHAFLDDDGAAGVAERGARRGTRAPRRARR